MDEENGEVELPDEILIPEDIDIEDDDAVSDYISDQTGFCHGGFRIVPYDGIKSPANLVIDKENGFKCPFCGGTEFYAHQLVRMTVVVNGDNCWLREATGLDAIYYAEEPYGPYECVECGHEFNELK